MDSVITGRGGLGTINLVANGNDRTIGRDGNDSNFTNLPRPSPWRRSITRASLASYSTPGANCWLPPRRTGWSGIWTTDRTGADGYSTGANEAGNTDS